MSAAFALFFALALAQSASDEVRARAACAPAEAEIGEPIECTLDVEHPRGLRVRVDVGELALGDSWLVLEEGSVVTVGDDENAARAHTRARWVLASLEPGERAVSLPAAQFEQGGAPRTLATAPAKVSVRPALAEGEDAPRPALGFRPPPKGSEPPFSPARLGLACALFVAAGGALLFVRARRRRSPPPPVAPTPLELLDRMKETLARTPHQHLLRQHQVAPGCVVATDPILADQTGQLRSSPPQRLARHDLTQPRDDAGEGFGLGRERGDVQALHYELAALVRAAVDARTGCDQRGLTDEEWLARAASAPEVSKEAHAELAQLLVECERVKYAQAAPTHWAAGETLDRARSLVQRLQGSAEAVEAKR